MGSVSWRSRVVSLKPTFSCSIYFEILSFANYRPGGIIRVAKINQTYCHFLRSFGTIFSQGPNILGSSLSNFERYSCNGCKQNFRSLARRLCCLRRVFCDLYVSIWRRTNGGDVPSGWCATKLSIKLLTFQTYPRGHRLFKASPFL